MQATDLEFLDTFTDPVEVAWATGLFEGEGCFWTQHQARSYGTYAYPNAYLAMTDEDVVRRFHAIVGVGKVSYRDKNRPASLGTKPFYVWRVSDQLGFARFVRLVRPLLGVRRTQQLDRVLMEATEKRRAPNQSHMLRG